VPPWLKLAERPHELELVATRRNPGLGIYRSHVPEGAEEMTLAHAQLTASSLIIKLREINPQLADATEALLEEANSKHREAIRVLADAKKRRKG
jgi:hypothetical protein